MTNVLITGAHGFLGKNLKQALVKFKDVVILESTRETTKSEWEIYAAKADFIYHFAGEVRPKSDDSSFQSGNVGSTQLLIDALIKAGRAVPILIASTIHAADPKNAYGQSKRDAELLVKAYAEKQMTSCWIYRLPHVFGEGCKPNYNSVISTWIFNRVHDLDVTVYDRGIKMTYVYVQDIVKEFAALVFSREENTGTYCSPELVYDTTLGEVIDLIEEFKVNIHNKDYKVVDTTFKSKLFETYKDYAKKIENESLLDTVSGDTE